MRAGCVLLLAAVTALLGCGGECRDEDGDGFGENCEAGSDCDDQNADFAADCSAAELLCEEDPFARGCTCLAGTRRACYPADPQTLGVGDCRTGRQRCPTGRWGACEDAVTPGLEACDGEDDDCDGFVDEGALSPCGGCNPECVGGVWGPPAVPFEADEDSALAVTDRGELTLRHYPLEALSVWVPNTGEGTLSKVDAVSAREVARYRVPGEAPERVAVNHNGDAWVLSPGFAGDSYLTKVGAEPAHCIDRDGDGLETSGDPADVLELGSDECVMLQLSVARPGEVARTLAVDGKRAPDEELGGDVWVGLQNAELMLELDGTTGEVVRAIETPGLAAYAAVFDPWGQLWAIDRGGLLARIRPGDPAEYELIEAPLRCYQFESLASDSRGVLTLTGFSCEDIVQYDPRSRRWTELKTPGVLDTRGVAVLGDENWVAHTAGFISRVERDPLMLAETFALAGDGADPLESIAVSADSHGMLWIVSSMGAPGGLGVLTRFDPMEMQVSAQVPLGVLPRAQGDLTGDRRFAVFAPEATAAHIFDGCGRPRPDADQDRPTAPTDWGRLHLDWLAGPGAHIDVQARRAESREALADAEWVELGTLPEDTAPFELPFATGGVLEVRLTLRVDGRDGAPRIARVGLEWSCQGPD